ncbi:MAG: transposase [Planctomycetota bacterium]
MGAAWDHWYHVTGCTYGAWLRGDPRGFRTRHHREHVEGDYRNRPPEGEYAELLEQSKRLMKREPVVLTMEMRQVALDAMVEAFSVHQCSVAAIAVGAQHYHILAQFQRVSARKVVGIAKKRAARALSESGLVAKGGVWAVRSRALPIRDRDHARNARGYIARHIEQRCAVFVARSRPRD